MSDCGLVWFSWLRWRSVFLAFQHAFSQTRPRIPSMKQCCIMVHHTPLTLVIHMPNVWLMYRTGEWWVGKKLQRSLSLDWSATLFRTHSGNLWLNWWLPLGVFSCPVQNNSEDECSKCTFFQSHFFARHKIIGCHKQEWCIDTWKVWRSHATQAYLHSFPLLIIWYF